jgi:ATP-dependent Lon protease
MGQEDKSNPDSVDVVTVVPVLPLRDVVVYPHMVIPLFVGREKSIKALDSAMDTNKKILLVAQKSAETDDPTTDDIHAVGTLANILQLLKLPDGTVKVLVEGEKRVHLHHLPSEHGYFMAEYKLLQDENVLQEREMEVLMRSSFDLFDQYVKLNKKVPPEVLTSLSNIDDPSRLAGDRL